MDKKIVELLEGKPDEHKYQAIAYSFACLLTGPKGSNSTGRETVRNCRFRCIIVFQN